MAGDGNGVVRKLVRNDIEVHLIGFDAPILHVHHGPVLGKVPPPAEGELLVGVVHLAVA